MSRQPVIILGSLGNCVDILECLLLCPDRFEPLGFLDDRPDSQGQWVHGYPVLGTLSQVMDFPQAHFITAIGSARSFRGKPALLQRLNLDRERFISLVHPSAQVSRWAHIGRGCLLLQQTVVAAGAVLEDQVVVLPQSVISHDAHIGRYSILAGGVMVNGSVRVGENCYLGAGSCLHEGIELGQQVLVGMGSVVLKSLASGTVVVGNPARPLSGRSSLQPKGSSVE